VRCNERVKYAALLDRARAVGFGALATGHHVRLRRDADGTAHLWRAADPDKDQTYVLYMADQRQLAATLWPVGEHHKSSLRAMAAERGLLTAAKPDSHDICFIPDGDLAGFLRPRLGQRAGTFIGPDGQTLGSHEGAYRFTVGQRRGLGLSGRRQPLYVTAIDGQQVHVGGREQLRSSRLLATGMSWIAGHPPASGGVTAQVRYRGRPLPCEIDLNGEVADVQFSNDEPEGVAPGQAVVFYEGQECLGGGTITRSWSQTSAASA
jgi:tRNA-specific 2-thiouridylase